MRGGICGGKFGGKVGEICKGQFAWVRTVAYTEEADVIVDNVAKCAVSLDTVYCKWKAARQGSLDIVLPRLDAGLLL